MAVFPDTDTIRAAARRIVTDMVGDSVTDSEPLISSGRIDSLSILKLIARMESSLEIALPADNLQPDDFDTVDWITDTVIRAGRPL